MELLTDFSRRHIGPRPSDVSKMLAEIGAVSLDDLIAQTVPAGIRSNADLTLDAPLSEPEAVRELTKLASENQVLTSMIGLGYYGTHTPAVIRRNVLENPSWYTAYTPYQPEISQGRLEVLLAFQTMVSDLTGLEVANASLLDEGTAAAEAMTMCRRLSKAGKDAHVFWVDEDCHPQTIAVCQTRAEPVGIEVRVGVPATFDFDGSFGALLAYPGSSGEVPDHRPAVKAAHQAGALVAVATDLLAITLLPPPGDWGADIAVGSSQRFGVPMGFGGPHAAFISTRENMVRALPGRLVGASKDRAGRTAFRLALQTREQHIRREKATSNVCTAQVLLAVMAALYASWHGPEGLVAIARRAHHLTGRLVASLRRNGFEVENTHWFDTITVRVDGRADEILERARQHGINLRRRDRDRVGISFDETHGEDDLGRLGAVFGIELTEQGDEGIPEARQGEFLTHEVFHRYRSEHEMLRYLRRLAERDLALDRTMIPLGSCTMKLNATTEMLPITLEGFANLHPFAPFEQTAGYRRLIGDLASYLEAITGYAKVSLQPNAGSQGELAGLLAIKAYHRSRGDADRDICLIPSSAHGTNAASAVMAGMAVVVVACDDRGNVDLEDLEAKASANAAKLAAAMVTYPSTHGVFEEGITRLCQIVHDAGGQVYVDGANLNALVGLSQPGHFGADVSHLNLHKTFTIPHGGGGPGIGPIGVGAHLAPFLPNHPLVDSAGPETGIGPVASAPWGSAGILPIPYTYIRLMGAGGLRRATEVAILNANYLAQKLHPHFPVLYTGLSGRVAHECILDLRPITRATGITAEDVAKRLADYGFHAPTLSFPVPGTLMVEPTESESLEELDRFCEAMVAIRAEIGKVEAGEWSEEESPLRWAPHPADDVISDNWDRAYSREVAAFPVSRLRLSKYWPPVSRIDGAGGDRNLICACPPLSEYSPD